MVMKEYVTIKTENLSLLKGRFLALMELFPTLQGAEVYCADLVEREKPFYNNEKEFCHLAEFLKENGVKRLHASYWASPSSYLCGIVKDELYSHFGGEDGVKAYYTDLCGTHLIKRWAQEYAVAKEIGAEAYVFHLIDYFPIDGLWRFAITPQQVLECMAQITDMFLKELGKQNIICQNSPLIELENAGWGLEYGTQTAKDFEYIFSKVEDTHNRLRISWDVNHLLHATGQRDGKGCFMLPCNEITEDMVAIEKQYGNNPQLFAYQWVKYNLLYSKTADKVSSIQLADCVLKEHQYFTQGYMEYPWRTQLESCATAEEQENYGVEIVLGHYDSHVPLGKGILCGNDMLEIIGQLEQMNPQLSILHELKNSTDLTEDLKAQRTALFNGG